MIERILLCVPIIMKVIPIILMVFYIWAIIGIENLNTKTHQYKEDSPYEEYNYADMNSF